MGETLKRSISGIIYVLVMWFGVSYSQLSFNILFAIIGVWSLYEMFKLRKGKSKLIAFLYVIAPFCLIHLFVMTDQNYSQENFNPSIVLLMFILTWTFDTFAYLTGMKFGKNKILPSISPKKSWEGFIGGFLFTLLAGFLSQFFFRSSFDNISLLTIVCMSIILPFTATIGDFIESHYKRQAGVKDSGSFIPGHGGILDRMDAFMITIPVIYILLNLT
jgi:phosphatidate cytidylyltransferase